MPTILQPSVQLADPHICSDAKNRLNLLSAIFDTLVRRDAAGLFVAGLASEWHVADDAQTWTFALRDDVLFHNGEQMRASDVVASLRRACDPSVGGELGTEGVWASYLGDAAISVADGNRVQVVTSQPMADLLDLLVAIPIMPQSVLADLPNVFVGSGPWKLAAHDGERVVLETFADSRVRQPAIERESGSGVQRLSWQAVPDEALRIEALRAGRADLITDLSYRNTKNLDKTGHRVLARQSNLCVAFLCNASRGPCADRQVRQALNYAVDVERMIEQALDGGAAPLNGPLTPHHFGCDPMRPAYSHNPDKAYALLAASGAETELVVDLPTTIPNEAPLLGELLAEDLADIGFEVELRSFTDRTAYAHMVKAKEIDDVCCFDSSPLSTYRVLREKLNSDVAGPWWQGYHNAKVNGLLDDASRTVDTAQRQAIYRQAYRLLVDDAPWVALYHPTNYWASNDGSGLSVDASVEGVLRLQKK